MTEASAARNSASITLSVHPSIHEIDAAAWDACALDGEGNPFLAHAFLAALEDSGAVTAEEGWLPQHLALKNAEGKLMACAPVYLKGHSYGEYVFDWAWADAYHRAGGQYYPKLQVASPFSPVTGRRLLTHPEGDRTSLQHTLLAGLMELAKQHKVSSLHVTFCQEDEYNLMGESGLLQRIGQQYHWQNKGYTCFDDFLADLSSRKRKSIRKEREKANSHGITIRALTGDDLKPQHWDAFHRFYLSTIDKKWAQAYLNREFFHRLGATMADKTVLIMGFDDETPICGALNLLGNDAIYGRNWGADGDFRYLHFEVCYYRAIDFAIEHNLTWVEAGAQGQHKIQRGYLPRTTYSTHYIADPGFKNAVARYLEQEREAINEDMEILTEMGPFKRGGGDAS